MILNILSVTILTVYLFYHLNEIKLYYLTLNVLSCLCLAFIATHGFKKDSPWLHLVIIVCVQTAVLLQHQIFSDTVNVYQWNGFVYMCRVHVCMQKVGKCVWSEVSANGDS